MGRAQRRVRRAAEALVLLVAQLDPADLPRDGLGQLGVERRASPRHGADTFCCGAGGGRIWGAEPGTGERPSEQRIREAQALGDLDYFVVTCPKDLTMYTAAAVAVGGVAFESWS